MPPAAALWHRHCVISLYALKEINLQILQVDFPNNFLVSRYSGHYFGKVVGSVSLDDMHLTHFASFQTGCRIIKMITTAIGPILIVKNEGKDPGHDREVWKGGKRDTSLRMRRTQRRIQGLIFQLAQTSCNSEF